MRTALFLGLVAAVCLSAQAPAADDGWAPLFDGKSLKGWVQRGGKAKYVVEGDAIVGTSVPNTPNSFLCTEKEYADFELELEFKVHPQLNSGVQIRSEYVPEGKTVEFAGKTIKGPRVYGYQVEIDPAPRSFSGAIYDEGRRGVFLKDLKDNEPARKAFKQGEWNKFRIVCQGDSLKTWINGVPAVEVTDKVTPKGFIALQVHSVGKKEEPLDVRWRNIRIKELK
jgi:hypothetical protein